MSITAQEAADARFSEARRGFDPDEVELYRVRVVEVLKYYEGEITRLGLTLKTAQERGQDLADAEDAVKRTFIAASQAKREILEEAEAEATRLVDEARASAESTTTQAESAARKAKSDADAEAKRTVAAAQDRAQEAETQTKDELKRMERRLAQLRTAVGDIEGRLKALARGSLGEVEVMRDLIELEGSSLDEMEPFQAAMAERAVSADTTDESVESLDEDVGAVEAEAEADAMAEAAAVEAAWNFEETAATQPPRDEVIDLEAIEAASPQAVPAPGEELFAQAEASPEPVSHDSESPIEAKLRAAEAPEEGGGEAIVIDVTADEQDDGDAPEIDEEARLRAKSQVLTGEDEPTFYQRRLAGLRERLDQTDE